LTALAIIAADVATLDAVGGANRARSIVTAESGTTIVVAVAIVAGSFAVKSTAYVDIGAGAVVAFAAAALPILRALLGVRQTSIT
jgi:hypothetical protein